MITRKGIILAGGSGSRLWPITQTISKHLIPIYDKPMIYYPLSVLMLSKIRDVLVIINEQDLSNYKRLLGDGSNFGMNIQYAFQEQPRGIADALIIAEDFIDGNNCCLILGDNIFYGHNLIKTMIEANQNNGATIFGYKVKDPERFGIVEISSKNEIISLEEKPKAPKSNIAITGLYFFDSDAVSYAKSLEPSSRGELEITDLNKMYLDMGKLNLKIFERGITWLDTGTVESLSLASQFVASVQKSHNFYIACLEEIALNNHWIDPQKLKKSSSANEGNSYKEYIHQL